MKKLVLALFLSLLSLSAFAQSKSTLKLFKAIEKNNVILASSAINEGADVNGIDDMKNPTTSVLLKAIELQRHDIVKLLLAQNSDVNQRRPIDFFSGLMIAVKNNDGKMTELLINSGADVNLEMLNGQTALHLAAIHNSIDSGKVLINSKDIDVNIGGERCALSLAAKNKSVGMALLLKKQSGRKATSPVCIEKAISYAEKVDASDVVRILKRD